ncbi:DUF5688 family protein [Aminipila sp.]|uniref:DUF5688 family protein n=1 Tax=Aminipila sp. TaxID=2060095 RepID=UPI00289D3071|nr:DUF5688 family protein [Aminipila sp.]
MINYELFKEGVLNKIIGFMPEEYTDYEVKVDRVKKVNQTLDCLNLIPKESKEWRATPNIYLEHMYEDFKQHEDLEKSLHQIALIIDYAFKNLKPQPITENISELKHTLIMILINTQDNLELLENAPHRSFLDLSIIYKLMVPASNGELGTVLVDYQFMKMLNMTEDELYKTASQNTKTLLPIMIKRLDDVIGDMLEENVEEKSNFYVISNDMGVNGAISMTYEEELYKLAQKLESDLFILPSSIHEVIAVSSQSENVEWLKELVRSVNTEQVAVEERLSNSVYQYKRKSRKISIAF